MAISPVTELQHTRVDPRLRTALGATVWPRPAPVEATPLRWYHRMSVVVTLVDLAMLVVAFGGAYLTRFGTTWNAEVSGSSGIGHFLVVIAAIVAWMLLLHLGESASLRLMGSGTEEYRLVIEAAVYTFLIVTSVSFLAELRASRFLILTALPAGVALTLLGRWLIRIWVGKMRRNGQGVYRTVVVGTHAAVDAVLADLLRRPQAGFAPIAVFVTDGGQGAPTAVKGLPSYDYRHLDTYLAHNRVGAVVVGDGVAPQTTRELAWRLEDQGAELLLTPRVTDVAGPRLSYQAAAGLDLVHVALPSYAGSRFAIKRLFDIVFSALALIGLSPVLLAIAAAIKLDSKGPVLFVQERVGLGGEPIKVHKFRTMVVDAEKRLAELRAQSDSQGPLFKMKHDPRITRVGAFLRKTSLDELPQFLTVLMGRMSVVGPRPHLVHELVEFPNNGLRRLLIKPGITGLWQVSGRSDLSIEESVRLDLRYVENWSLAGDIVIVLQTVKTMLKPSGAY